MITVRTIFFDLLRGRAHICLQLLIIHSQHAEIINHFAFTFFRIVISVWQCGTQCLEMSTAVSGTDLDDDAAFIVAYSHTVGARLATYTPHPLHAVVERVF